MTLWYVTRATGVVALVLLTVTVSLGLANAARVHSMRVPRFVVNGVHRNASLLAVCFLGAHVATVVADGYVSIPVASVLVPFTSGYKPFWVGLGTVSLDLAAAVIVTSLVRKRIGNRAWRATHWLAYASWPVAVAHSIGTGTDASTRWMLALTAICVAAVTASLRVRLASSRQRQGGGGATPGRQGRAGATPGRRDRAVPARPQPPKVAPPLRGGAGYPL